MKRLLRTLKRYLIPHRRNRYKPRIFSKESIGALVLCLLLIEGLYLVQIHIVLKNSGFLAAVLPAAITSLTNADRAAQGLDGLTPDPLLAQAAQEKADDMAAKGYFAHVAPDGKTPWYWLDDVHYQYSYAGENLAVDFTDSQDVETAWMNSPMHRANILKAQYTRIGIGIAQGMYQGKETTFVVQFFATQPGDGVASASQNTAPAAVSAASVPATDLATTQTPARVLGSETGAPKDAPVPAAVKVDTAAAQVSSSEITAAPSANVAVAVTSPSHFIVYLLSGLAGAFLVILLMTLIAHVRKQIVYMEVLTGSFVIVGVAVLMLVYDQGTLPTVPNASESASAAIAL